MGRLAVLVLEQMVGSLGRSRGLILAWAALRARVVPQVLVVVVVVLQVQVLEVALGLEAERALGWEGACLAPILLMLVVILGPLLVDVGWHYGCRL